MLRKKISTLLLSCAILLTGCVKTTPVDNPTLKSEYQPTECYNLKLCCLKLGKADGMVIQTQNYTVVIDCGEKSDGSKMRRCLNALGVEKIDYMILTHYDQDHIGGASKVIDNFEVSHIFAPDYAHSESSEFRKLTESMTEKNLDFEFVKQDTSIILDDAKFIIYPSESDSYLEGDDNNFSLVTRLQHHENIFLFTADAMYERLEEIMDLGDCTFLKEPYHGRELKNLGKFLDAVTPEYTVISTSEEYLAESTITALQERDIETYLTYEQGNMEFISDGKTLQFQNNIEYPKVNSEEESST